ncbi:S-adenosylmethionine sensor upstream of mTORC1 [Eumeta japonica]|uniref:S-adenosylmethionine sensor upstream of mTORC1 n=1 Tax=Eumeta variegata TaxID=151549 RepID=A0A4C1VK29_EUMVA|nr:S-adenosylmethionine sensor upstream of mTORC1 [Eumeta japonica]
MASEQHKELAQFLKNVHTSLRQLSSKIGSESAWTIHCENVDLLQKYAQKMQELATVHWEGNKNKRLITSRIKWAVDFCCEYFVNKSYVYYRNKELNIANKIGRDTCIDHNIFFHPIRLLDVGSCYNPFSTCEFFEVTAIDLCPANDTVLQCDFLSVQIDKETLIENAKVKTLEEKSFDVIAFCFVLEYLPTSNQRIAACDKAYKLLKSEGIMIICTPDSKHIGANAKLMKCWRYTLACMGFSRIKYEKFDHMHCMSFRKSIHKDIAIRWATLHKEPYMDNSLHIPQDFQTEECNFTSVPETCMVELLDFSELPFSDSLFNETI